MYFTARGRRVNFKNLIEVITWDVTCFKSTNRSQEQMVIKYNEVDDIVNRLYRCSYSRKRLTGVIRAQFGIRGCMSPFINNETIKTYTSVNGFGLYPYQISNKHNVLYTLYFDQRSCVDSKSKHGQMMVRHKLIKWQQKLFNIKEDGEEQRLQCLMTSETEGVIVR